MIKKLKNELKSYTRVGRHRGFLYERIIELHNNINREFFKMNLETDVEVIRKQAKRKNQTCRYLICKISKDDLDLINKCRHDLTLAKKYNRRLKLLNY
tara:strand:- start:791 stop:1084 length:294 start_codon:yes stop_codon:yes gene_type:complete